MREIFRKLVGNGVKILSRSSRYSVETLNVGEARSRKKFGLLTPHLPPSSPINTVDPTKQPTPLDKLHNSEYKRSMQRQTKKKKKDSTRELSSKLLSSIYRSTFSIWNMHTDREREEEKVKRFARIAATYIEILWKPRMRERKDSSLIRTKALIKD